MHMGPWLYWAEEEGGVGEMESDVECVCGGTRNY